MNFGNIHIGLKSPPLVIAEMSGNHNQSLDRALQIIDVVAEIGIPVLKLQTYTADTITIDSTRPEFCITDKNSLWAGETLYSLYQKAHTPWEWFPEIISKSKKKGILTFSSVFDKSSVEYMEEMSVGAYKIASQECVDLPLIKQVAETNKPIFLSTGMASLSEIDEAVNTILRYGSSDFMLFKCTSTYPANPKESNLATIPEMRRIFGCEVGLSDHTPGIGVALAAISMGATVIEKHLTLNRNDGAVDSAFSLEPNEMKALKIESCRAWEALGEIKFGPTPSEIPSMKGRRSLYVTSDIKRGQTFDQSNVKSIRPSNGLPTKYAEVFWGKTAAQDIDAGTPLEWRHLGL